MLNCCSQCSETRPSRTGTKASDELAATSAQAGAPCPATQASLCCISCCATVIRDRRVRTGGPICAAYAVCCAARRSCVFHRFCFAAPSCRPSELARRLVRCTCCGLASGAGRWTTVGSGAGHSWLRRVSCACYCCCDGITRHRRPVRPADELSPAAGCGSRRSRCAVGTISSSENIRTSGPLPVVSSASSCPASRGERVRPARPDWCGCDHGAWQWRHAVGNADAASQAGDARRGDVSFAQPVGMRSRVLCMHAAHVINLRAAVPRGLVAHSRGLVVAASRALCAACARASHRVSPTGVTVWN